MTVTTATARQVAQLARLHLSDEGAVRAAADLSSILEHMTVLNSFTGVEAGREGSVTLAADEIGSDPLARPFSEFAPEFANGLLLVARLAAHQDGESA